MFPLQEIILHQKYILFFIKILERETVKVFVLKFSHTMEICEILAYLISALSAWGSESLYLMVSFIIHAHFF